MSNNSEFLKLFFTSHSFGRVAWCWTSRRMARNNVNQSDNERREDSSSSSLCWLVPHESTQKSFEANFSLFFHHSPAPSWIGKISPNWKEKLLLLVHSSSLCSPLYTFNQRKWFNEKFVSVKLSRATTNYFVNFLMNEAINFFSFYFILYCFREKLAEIQALMCS